MITDKYCWICGKYFPEDEIEAHKDEHYQKGNQRKREHKNEIEKEHKKLFEKKLFNPIKGLDKI